MEVPPLYLPSSTSPTPPASQRRASIHTWRSGGLARSGSKSTPCCTIVPFLCTSRSILISICIFTLMLISLSLSLARPPSHSHATTCHTMRRHATPCHTTAPHARLCHSTIHHATPPHTTCTHHPTRIRGGAFRYASLTRTRHRTQMTARSTSIRMYLSSPASRRLPRHEHDRPDDGGPHDANTRVDA